MATAESNQDIIEHVVESLSSLSSSNPLIEKFARLFLGSVASHEFAGRKPADMAAATAHLWNYLNKCTDECQIKAFNPDLKRHGWGSDKTLIMVVHDDMPFLVDSIRMELNRQGIDTHLHLHVPFNIKRGKDNQLTALAPLTKSTKSNNVTVMLVEIEHQASKSALKKIETNLNRVLADVRLTVSDWRPMRDRLGDIIEEVEKDAPPLEEGRVDEAIKFLRWIHNNHFVLMGYKLYDLVQSKSSIRLDAVKGSGLGIMRDDSRHKGHSLTNMPKGAQRLALAKENMLVLTKTSSTSTVHRPSHVDYVGIKRFDAKGNVIGEHRFLGLFTSAAYSLNPFQVPVLRQKCQQVVERSGLIPGGHDHKALINILETYPRDELMQISADELLETAMGILNIQERRLVKIFVRRDPFGRYFSCLLYVPRDIYNTRLRLKVTEILERTFKSTGNIKFTTYFSESNLSRTHFIVPVKNAETVKYDSHKLEAELTATARSWDDNLGDAIDKEYGKDAGEIKARYMGAFPPGYKDEVTPANAVLDIGHMEKLGRKQRLSMVLYRPRGAKRNQLRFKLFHLNKPMALSEVLPMLENMGLRVIDEIPHKIEPEGTTSRWVMDFSVAYEGSSKLVLDEVREPFQQAFAASWLGHLEDDGFNRLVLDARMSWREVIILRAYAKYLWQLGFTFSQTFIEATMADYPNIARQLVDYFNARFNPEEAENAEQLNERERAIVRSFDAVANLDQDKIFNRYLKAIKASVRTNFYQKDSAGNPKEYVSIKVRPAEIPEVPLPVPMFEVFVYSPRVEGVHLRGGKVARGGLRWSDRREDFRTEILGLVKAQQVKNSVIVPVGAKGGFVCKKMPKGGDREAISKEGIACYKTFIRSLLDITDNYLKGELHHPENVVVLDEPDPYLVVAADKGTATFSDTANAISADYNFWLGDAFASGGSVGYDHKKMGITARGAWESVKLLFREMGVDTQTTDFTVVGVGDMGGDVFGNGMLCSEHIRLQGAFNHLHIFVDPNPDSAKSFKERKRLFEMPRSSWEDYNKKLISKGGGVFRRDQKSIELSEEIQAMLKTRESAMSPNQLIRSLLLMDVDLFWNGGIGTYVKSRTETDAEVGDRANDALRVNGGELRCKVIGEGGNLGFTQRGRIEYMRNGGRGHTDFIDNAGGVNCSDNEVNIKILLNAIVDSGELTLSQRNKLLASMTDEVAKIVLDDNYRQIQSISITESKASSMVKEHLRFIHAMEKTGELDRELEFLPSDEEVQERISSREGLTRAELSVLLAYGKMGLKESLQVPEILNDSYFEKLLHEYFPEPLQERYSGQMANHRLKEKIIAMCLANEMVNFMGSNFAFRVSDETGAKVGDVARCFTMAKDIFGMTEFWREVESYNNKVPARVQTEMLYQSRRTIRRITRWFIRHQVKHRSISNTVEHYRGGVVELQKHISVVLEAKEAKGIEKDAKALSRQGVPKTMATQVAYFSTMFSALDIVDLSKQHDLPVKLVAEVYYKLGARTELHWFLEQVVDQPVANHWQAFARAAFREELDVQQRYLTDAVLSATTSHQTAEEKITHWIQSNRTNLQRWRQMVSDFRSTSSHEFAKFSVALRELTILVQQSLRESSK